MGHRLITQNRGRGGSTYRAPSHRYFGEISFARSSAETVYGEVMDLVNSVGHSSPLMVVKYADGQESLLPAPIGIRLGEIVAMGANVPIKNGNVARIGDIPNGTFIYNLEVQPLCGGKLVRTSGTAATVVGRHDKFILVKLPSNKTVELNPNCRAIIGIVAGGGRVEKPFVKGGKRNAARKARGKKHPLVSGVAMNAVDHPFGGTHRRTKGRPTTTARNTPPGRKVGLIAARKTGRGK